MQPVCVCERVRVCGSAVEPCRKEDSCCKTFCVGGLKEGEGAWAAPGWASVAALGFHDASLTHKTVTLPPRIHYTQSCETLLSVSPKLWPHSHFVSLVENVIGNDRRRNAAKKSFHPSSPIPLHHFISSLSRFTIREKAKQLKRADFGQLCSKCRQRRAASNRRQKEMKETR